MARKAAVAHRPGSKREKAHQIILRNRGKERDVILKKIRALRVKESTATAWYYQMVGRDATRRGA